jgi:hypothetical protein
MQLALDTPIPVAVASNFTILTGSSASSRPSPGHQHAPKDACNEAGGQCGGPQGCEGDAHSLAHHHHTLSPIKTEVKFVALRDASDAGGAISGHSDTTYQALLPASATAAAAELAGGCGLAQREPASPDSVVTAPKPVAAAGGSPVSAAVIKVPELVPLPPPDASEGPEAAAEYEIYLQRWDAGDTLAQRWHRWVVPFFDALNLRVCGYCTAASPAGSCGMLPTPASLTPLLLLCGMLSVVCAFHLPRIQKTINPQAGTVWQAVRHPSRLGRLAARPDARRCARARTGSSSNTAAAGRSHTQRWGRRWQRWQQATQGQGRGGGGKRLSAGRAAQGEFSLGLGSLSVHSLESVERGQQLAGQTFSRCCIMTYSASQSCTRLAIWDPAQS